MSLLKSFVCTGLALTALYLAAELGGQQPLDTQLPPPEELEEKAFAGFESRPIKADKKDNEVHRLLKKRYNESLIEMVIRLQEFLYGRGTLDHLTHAKQRFLRAGLELREKPAEQLAIYRDCLKAAQQVENSVQMRFTTGRTNRADLAEARSERADAELQLLRAKLKARRAERK